MPQMMSGFGTMYYGYSAAVYWEKPGIIATHQPNYDTVNCVVVLFVPVFALRPVHVFDCLGSVHKTVQLRWTPMLLLQAYLRPLLLLTVGISVFLWLGCGLAIGVELYSGNKLPPQIFALVPWLLIGPTCLFALGWMGRAVRRNRDIRLVIGRHEMGSSDPALWAKEVLAAIKIGQTDTVKAAEKALKQKNFASAMYSARYTVALGDSLCGEELTDRILATPEIAAILPQLRREPWRRSEWIPAIEKSTNTNTSAATEATPERTHESAGLKSGAVFYDGRFYSNEILDAAGGSGFAEFVRGNPRIEVPIRASAFFQGLKIFFALFLVVAGIGGYVSESQSGKPMNELMKAFFGLAAMCAFLGWSFWEARKNRIILANGTIFVGRKSGHATFIDAIKRVRRRRFVFVKKVVSVEHVGGEVMWPVQGPAKSLVESVIEIAIKLRSEWVSDVNGAARVDAMKVD